MKGATVGRKDDFSQLQPLDQKFLKLSKVHQTCRTGREVFWKCFCNSVEGFLQNRLFFITKSGGLEIFSEQNPMFLEESS